jgi:hypothetical protein
MLMKCLRMMLFFKIFICCLLLSPYVASADSNFKSKIADDTRSFGILRDNLQRASEISRSHPELFGKEKEKTSNLISREEKLSLWGMWSLILDSTAALDGIRQDHGKLYFLNDNELSNESFTLSYAAFLTEYRNALEFIDLAVKEPALDIILNESVPEFGIPAGTFDKFKFRFLNVAVATEFAALQVIDRSKSNDSKELRGAITLDSSKIWEMGKGKGHVLTLENALAVVRKAGFKAWFPVQKGVSEWMGDTKVYRKHRHLISSSQIDSMPSRLLPGDILFERHEWYLSNMGLPGFWTHVALYVGTPEERRSYFNDLEVRGWVKEQGVLDGDLEKLLQKLNPNAYANSTKQLEEGHVPRILEAISEGVVFTSIETSGASDSLGVVRPMLSKREKAQAILRSFHYSGRPYDFDFNFATDSALVCSELVFKAYEPGEGMKGCRFPLTEILGRKVSTPNNMVRQFDEQVDSTSSQAEFVLFFDGFEKEGRAVESTKEEFRQSWQRPNWHILIQDDPT